VLYNDRGRELDVRRAQGDDDALPAARQYIFRIIRIAVPAVTVFDILREPRSSTTSVTPITAPRWRGPVRLVGLDPRFLNPYLYSRRPAAAVIARAGADPT
jgi:hypothetical protein